MLTDEQVRDAYDNLMRKRITLDLQVKALDREFEKLKYDCPHKNQASGRDNAGDAWRTCKDCHAQLWPVPHAKY